MPTPPGTTVMELAQLRRGRVRLGATPSLCTGLLPDVLRDFHDRHPGIQLLLEEGGSHDLVRELARGALDLALVVLPLPSPSPALTTVELFQEDLVGGLLPRRARAALPGADRRSGAAADGDVPARLRPAGPDADRLPRRRIRAVLHRGGRRDGRGARLRPRGAGRRRRTGHGRRPHRATGSG